MRGAFKENLGAAIEKGGVKPGRQEQQTLRARLAWMVPYTFHDPAQRSSSSL